jgi:hypothetical protein
VIESTAMCGICLALILEKKLSMIILEPKKYGDKKYAKEDGEGNSTVQPRIDSSLNSARPGT